MTKIYVTKYALTSGPFIVEAEIVEPDVAVYTVGNSYTQYAHKNEFFLNEEEATANCDRRREAKLKNIEKQKTKLEKMTFTFQELQ